MWQALAHQMMGHFQTVEDAPENKKNKIVLFGYVQT